MPAEGPSSPNSDPDDPTTGSSRRSPEILGVEREQSSLTMRQHGCRDVCIVDLLAPDGNLAAKRGQHRHDVWTILQDGERGDQPRCVLQGIGHGERFRPDLRASDRSEILADDLAADVQGFFAVAGAVEAPAGGHMTKGVHETDCNENIGTNEHTDQGSSPGMSSGPPVKRPMSP